MIRLKVDDIMNDGSIGRLPSFAQTDYGYSATSSVTIENDTEYEWAHFIFSVKIFENIYLHYFLKLSKYVLPKF